jgi:hypothetical protein
MTISKKVREEAAVLCAMAASASAAFSGDPEKLAFIGDAEQWSYASKEAQELAMQAMHVTRRHPQTGTITEWHILDAEEKADAEAMLRTDWSP